MDTRIGYPNEHLAKESGEDLSSPLFATAVGLVMRGLEQKEVELTKMHQAELDSAEATVPEIDGGEAPEPVEGEELAEDNGKKKSYFDRWVDKFLKFLANDE